MVAGSQWSQRGHSLTTRTGSRMLEFTQETAPSVTSYAIHSTRSRYGHFCVSCHTSFTSPEDPKQHVSGTLPV